MEHLYLGHHSQMSGVEEHRLIGGKGDGMRLFLVRNGKGLEFTISADRCADISRLTYKGDNYGYFSPTGYVGPQYYDCVEEGFLKSFTAGFLTTCGLKAVGQPCTDEGKRYPLHGGISNCPAENIYAVENKDEIRIHAQMSESVLFGEKLILKRTIICSKEENEIVIRDTIENQGSDPVPALLLYHINIGYPLLCEDAKLYIDSKKVIGRNEHATKDLSSWNQIIPPTYGFEEQCYYHEFDEKGFAAIFNPKLGKGISISFDPANLDYFTQWKMMGERDYVLGLEPGNCNPDGRDVMRAQGALKYVAPNQPLTYEVKLEMLDKWDFD